MKDQPTDTAQPRSFENEGQTWHASQLEEELADAQLAMHAGKQEVIALRASLNAQDSFFRSKLDSLVKHCEAERDRYQVLQAELQQTRQQAAQQEQLASLYEQKFSELERVGIALRGQLEQQHCDLLELRGIEQFCQAQAAALADEQEKSVRLEGAVSGLRRDKLDLELKLEDYHTISNELVFANKAKAAAEEELERQRQMAFQQEALAN